MRNCGILSTVEALYTEVLSVEKEKGMDSAQQFMNEKLQNLGFSSYNEFMIHDRPGISVPIPKFIAS